MSFWPFIFYYLPISLQNVLNFPNTNLIFFCEAESSFVFLISFKQNNWKKKPVQPQTDLICSLMFSENQYKLFIKTHKVSLALLKHYLNDA